MKVQVYRIQVVNVPAAVVREHAKENGWWLPDRITMQNVEDYLNDTHVEYDSYLSERPISSVLDETVIVEPYSAKSLAR